MSSRSSTTSVALSGAFDSSGVPQQFDMRHLVRNVTLALGRLQLGITAAGKGNPPRHAGSAASVASAETETPPNSGVSHDFIEAVLARIVVEVLQACRVQEPSATPVDTALAAVALTTQLSALHISILRRLVQEDEPFHHRSIEQAWLVMKPHLRQLIKSHTLWQAGEAPTPLRLSLLDAAPPRNTESPESGSDTFSPASPISLTPTATNPPVRSSIDLFHPAPVVPPAEAAPPTTVDTPKEARPAPPANRKSVATTKPSTAAAAPVSKPSPKRPSAPVHSTTATPTVSISLQPPAAPPRKSSKPVLPLPLPLPAATTVPPPTSTTPTASPAPVFQFSLADVMSTAAPARMVPAPAAPPASSALEPMSPASQTTGALSSDAEHFSDCDIEDLMSPQHLPSSPVLVESQDLGSTGSSHGSADHGLTLEDLAQVEPFDAAVTPHHARGMELLPYDAFDARSLTPEPVSPQELPSPAPVQTRPSASVPPAQPRASSNAAAVQPRPSASMLAATQPRPPSRTAAVSPPSPPLPAPQSTPPITPEVPAPTGPVVAPPPGNPPPVGAVVPTAPRIVKAAPQPQRSLRESFYREDELDEALDALNVAAVAAEPQADVSEYVLPDADFMTHLQATAQAGVRSSVGLFSPVVEEPVTEFNAPNPRSRQTATAALRALPPSADVADCASVQLAAALRPRSVEGTPVLTPSTAALLVTNAQVFGSGQPTPVSSAPHSTASTPSLFSSLLQLSPTAGSDWFPDSSKAPTATRASSRPFSSIAAPTTHSTAASSTALNTAVLETTMTTTRMKTPTTLEAMLPLAEPVVEFRAPVMASAAAPPVARPQSPPPQFVPTAPTATALHKNEPLVPPLVRPAAMLVAAGAVEVVPHVVVPTAGGPSRPAGRAASGLFSPTTHTGSGTMEETWVPSSGSPKQRPVSPVSPPHAHVRFEQHVFMDETIDGPQVVEIAPTPLPGSHHTPVPAAAAAPPAARGSMHAKPPAAPTASRVSRAATQVVVPVPRVEVARTNSGKLTVRVGAPDSAVAAQTAAVLRKTMEEQAKANPARHHPPVVTRQRSFIKGPKVTVRQSRRASTGDAESVGSANTVKQAASIVLGAASSLQATTPALEQLTGLLDMNIDHLFSKEYRYAPSSKPTGRYLRSKRSQLAQVQL